MAITQERVHKITQAGQHYQWLWREGRKLALELALGNLSTEAYWDALSQLTESPEHVETLAAEAAHYKYTRHRNNYSRAKMAERRARAKGEEPAEPLPSSRPYNLQSPAEKRVAKDEAPSAPNIFDMEF